MSDNSKEKRIGYYLERTTRIVKLSFYKVFNNLGLDLTPEQWVVLDALYNQNGMSQTELASLSFKNPPTISRIIDVLCKKGYTQRRATEKDRRKFQIVLTDEGSKVVDVCKPAIKNLRQKSWTTLSDQDYEEAKRILDQIFTNLQQE